MTVLTAINLRLGGQIQARNRSGDALAAPEFTHSHLGDLDLFHAHGVYHGQMLQGNVLLVDDDKPSPKHWETLTRKRGLHTSQRNGE